MPRRPRTVRVPVHMPALDAAAQSRPAVWLRNFRLSGFALAMLALVVAALLVLAAPLKTLVEQRQQIAEYQQDVKDAQAQVDELNGEIARWSDPAYIEAQARERLYYVMPGDVSYLVVGSSAASADQGQLPISDEIQEETPDWLHGLLSATFAAGLTDATPTQLESPTQQ